MHPYINIFFETIALTYILFALIAIFGTQIKNKLTHNTN